MADSSKAYTQRVQQRQPKLEAVLLRLCVKYLLFDKFDQNDLLSKEQETAQRLEELPEFGLSEDSDDDGLQVDSFATTRGLENEQGAKNVYYDPSERGFGEFFVYASCFLVDHFNVTAPEYLPDTSDIVSSVEQSRKGYKIGSSRTVVQTAPSCQNSSIIATFRIRSSLYHCTDPRLQ